MKTLFLLATLLSSTSALAVPDPTQVLSPEQMAGYVSQYKASIQGVGCGELVPIAGKAWGGSTPGFVARYVDLEMSLSTSQPASKRLVISRVHDEQAKKSVLSFECQSYDEQN